MPREGLNNTAWVAYAPVTGLKPVFNNRQPISKQIRY